MGSWVPINRVLRLGLVSRFRRDFIRDEGVEAVVVGVDSLVGSEPIITFVLRRWHPHAPKIIKDYSLLDSLVGARNACPKLRN